MDLNGKTLTADSVTAAFDGTHVVDSKGTGKIDSDSVSVMNNNEQLPVTTEEGLVFETVTFAEDLNLENKQYKFYIMNEAVTTMLDNAILSGEAVSIDVTVTWTEAEGDGEKKFTLDNVLLQEYAGNWDTKMIVLTFASLDGITNLDCTARVSCNGVTVKA